MATLVSPEGRVYWADTIYHYILRDNQWVKMNVPMVEIELFVQWLNPLKNTGWTFQLTDTKGYHVQAMLLKRRPQ